MKSQSILLLNNKCRNLRSDVIHIFSTKYTLLLVSLKDHSTGSGLLPDARQQLI